MTRRFQLVDVFSEEPFLGNPLAVVVDADGLTSEEMQTITRWMNLSETAFLLPPSTDEADYRVRIFTLGGELPFAGHPTLGSCHAWLGTGGRPNSEAEIVQECGAGLILIRRSHSGLAFAAPPLRRTGPVDDADLEEITGVLGIEPDDVVHAEWADNGPGWVVVLLDSAQSVLDLEPARSHGRPISIGVVGPHPAGADAAFELRAIFSDQHGAVIEDPATGSLNASVAQLLLGSRRAIAPYRAAQGTRLGRTGRIRIDQDEAGVWVAGRTTTLVEGTITA